MYLKHGILSYFFNQFHKSLLITFKAPHLHGYNHHSQSLVSGLIANPCPSLIDLVQWGKSRQYCFFPLVPHSFLLQMKTAPSLFSRLNSIIFSFKQLTHRLLHFKVIECAKSLPASKQIRSKSYHFNTAEKDIFHLGECLEQRIKYHKCQLMFKDCDTFAPLTILKSVTSEI